jgi:hypothetical protein
VYVIEDGWVNGNEKYVAIIFLPGSLDDPFSDDPFISQLSARGPNRVKAVSAVWEKYNQYKEREKPHMSWYVEEAYARIEVELHKTIFNNGETNE